MEILKSVLKFPPPLLMQCLEPITNLTQVLHIISQYCKEGKRGRNINCPNSSFPIIFATDYSIPPVYH